MSRSHLSDVRARGASRSLLVLKIDASMLVLSQSDIRTIEGISDVSRSDPPHNGVGWIEFRDRGWPVYSLSEDLRPIAVVPQGRRLCAVVAGAGVLFGLLCDEAQVLESDASSFIPLPECMRYPGSPISHVAKHAGGIVCVGDSQALAGLTGAAAVVPSEGRHVAAVQ